VITASTLQIHEFRGIRDLTLDLSGKNFAVCGPNGTGKSGIVDALEFALTGNISRLSGAGTGGLSVKDHGPHVDSRNKPDQAYVSLKVRIESLKTDATIRRSVKDTKNPSFSPDSPEIRAVFARVALHPEFALSRRELIRYVLSEPGKRAKEVQELLRLDEVESLRMLLQRIANAADKEEKTRKSVRDEMGVQLMRALNITKVTAVEVLNAVNQKRQILTLPPIASLEGNTSLKDGIVSANSAPSSTVAKAQAKGDLDAANQNLVALQSTDFARTCADAGNSVAGLAVDAKFLAGASRESFLRQALSDFDEQVCPVCDTPWDSDKFRELIAHKLEQFNAVALRRKSIEVELKPISERLASLRMSLSGVVRIGANLQPEVDCTAIAEYTDRLGSLIGALNDFLPIERTTEALTDLPTVPESVKMSLAALEEAVAALPEPTQQDAAREFLIVGQERLESYRSATLSLKAAEERARLARHVFDTYGESTTQALESIYASVEKVFSRLYRLINQDDEDKFEAKLKPSIGKLGFDVDFYGRGFFPPGAYHSEGHQDGMGLCLYLALMDHLAGDAFTFAVLDDVLMSVDSGHRRAVSKMLVDEFPKTQFVLTTHDEIWLRHMQSVGLIQSKRFAQFRTWNVDVGPTEWSDREVWDEIAEHLKGNDVRAAAALLRHFLEHFSKEACHQLRAQVEFKGDAQFTLGDLLPNAVARMKKYLGAGKNAAQSWGQKDKLDSIVERDKNFSASVAATNLEQWQVNAAVHYNEWANLVSADFSQVVANYNTLVDMFSCAKCSSMIYVAPPHGSVETLRCSCGDVSINLLSK
jgi:hypothetical protein